MALSMKLAWSLSSKSILWQSYSLNHVCHRNFTTKKMDVADKPKKPMSVFLAYYDSIRKDLKIKYPDKKVSEISRVAAQMYRNLGEMDKKKLEETYLKEKKQYNAEMEIWTNNLTDEQKAEMQLTKEKKKTEKVEKQAIKDINKPKRPASGFFYFYQMKRQTLPYEKRSADQLTVVVKELSKVWETMPAVEKKKYDNEAAIERYKQELLEWEKQMVSKGVTSLVRKDVLKQLVPPKPKPAKKAQKSTKTAKKTETGSAKKTGKDTGSKSSSKSKEKPKTE